MPCVTGSTQPIPFPIGAVRTFFTHMTHDLPHAETCATLPEGMTLAHDGLELAVGEITPERALEAAADQLAAMHAYDLLP